MSDIDIAVSDKFQPAPDVEYEDKAEQPQEPIKEPEKAPEKTEEPEQTVEPAPAETPKTDETVKERPKKASPIASLLEKKHELEERASKAEAEVAQLKAQTQTPVTDSIQALAEKYEIQPEFLNELVSVAQKNLGVPKEVQNLIEKQKAEEVQQAELKGFNTRLDSLSKTFPAEAFKDPKVKDKLLELAYSTNKAPDGEPYFQKELSELYFAYIKPEIEPGKVSAESSQGGTQTTKVLDFQEILDRDDPKDFEKMDDETFKKFNAWAAEKQGRTPLRRL